MKLAHELALDGWPLEMVARKVEMSVKCLQEDLAKNDLMVSWSLGSGGKTNYVMAKGWPKLLSMKW